MENATWGDTFVHILVEFLWTLSCINWQFLTTYSKFLIYFSTEKLPPLHWGINPPHNPKIFRVVDAEKAGKFKFQSYRWQYGRAGKAVFLEKSCNFGELDQWEVTFLEKGSLSSLSQQLQMGCK